MSSLEVTTVDVLDSITVNNSVNAASVSATTVDVLDSITVNNSVNATSVNAASVSATTLSGNGASITSVTPADGTVTEAKLSNGAVTASKTASTIAKYADTTANFTGELQYGGIEVGYRNIPLIAATTVGTTHVGKCLTASTTVTVPNSTMAAGDVVSVFNTSGSDITLALNPTLAYVNGADAASATLRAYGVATVLFINSTTCVVTGNIS